MGNCKHKWSFYGVKILEGDDNRYFEGSNSHEVIKHFRGCEKCGIVQEITELEEQIKKKAKDD